MKFFAILLLIGLSESVFAFRCGSQLVSLGDTRYEVAAICGAPDDAISNTVYRSVAHGAVVDCDPIPVHRVGSLGMNAQRSRDSATRSCVSLVQDQLVVQVTVETWLYDFGKNRFMQQVTFADGRVSRIEQLGYGVKPRR